MGASYTIGGRPSWRTCRRDVGAGVTTLFIDYGYDERRPDPPDHTVADLAAAVAVILGG